MSVADTLSIQLYSLRNDGDLDHALDTVAGLGFRRVETVGGHLADAKATRKALDARGLTAPTGHVGLADLRERFDWVVDQAGIVGIEHIFMPAVPQEERDASADQWKAVGAELGAMAERMGKAGLKLGYHNHHWELKSYADGTRPLEHLFEAAKGSPLTWEADIAWLARGDVDPVEWLERYKPLLRAAHVKDIAPAGEKEDEDGWADVGEGVLDWPKLWREAASRGAVHMVLEHDKPKDGVRFARVSRAYLLETVA
ncbi:sugar phosphate isomerase/epimerase family protein [Marinivivus vitaminiproducens]|uniref:sugar phosphate isomerase/epimerase family protein n=1 Tax=Marinivivus vitaminiproducens TaxID=3035935 RepID=UPI00279E96F1|nr:sugar phosphate isomerase/epimerase [Geminicoccaceae bacterium SCSIO 64248]